MKKVVCDGAIIDPSGHQCRERKCKHRFLHKPVKDRCSTKAHNNSDAWCVFPGTVSYIDGQTDGNLVTCLTKPEIRKNQLKFNQYMLRELEEQKEQQKRIIKKDQEALNNLCRLIKFYKDKK